MPTWSASSTGDTLDLRIDHGFGIELTGDEARVRLLEIDTAGVFGAREGSDEYQAGQEHETFVQQWVVGAGGEEWPVYLETVKDDERGKYGRWLATIHRRSDGAELNDDLIEEFGDAVRSD